MFTKSQFNSKSDKAPSKQSVFPNNGNILKKKARTTILSVLTKRQTQEKFFLGEEKTDGRCEEQNSNVSTMKPSLQQPKWSTEAMIVDLGSTGSVSSQTPSYSETTRSSRSSSHFVTSDQNCPTSQSTDKVSGVKSIMQGKASSSVVEGRRANVEQTGLDTLDGSPRVSRIRSRWPPWYTDENRMGKSTQSLGERRDSAPKHSVSCPADITEAMVVSMSPSYTIMKDVTPNGSPTSPKSVIDSVMVPIPFQVQDQQQSSSTEQQSDVCVPFQVIENKERVCILPSLDNQSLPSSLPSDPTAEAEVRTASIPIIQESKTMSLNSLSVSKSTTTIRDTEGDSFSAINELSVCQTSLPTESFSFLSPDGDKGVSQDSADGGVVKKFRACSSSPSSTEGKRKAPKENHTRDKQVSAKEQLSKTMGKEASKHKATGKAVSSTALKVPSGGKPRAKSFTAGDKTKLTPGPSSTQSSPTGTPKSVSPASSPKLMRRNVTPRDTTKGRKTAEPKKQQNHSRPHSDPLIAEKIHGKKKSTGVAANDESTTAGKSKSDLDAVKNKVKDLESENLELKTKLQGMEHRLAVVPLLEKEKLHLQKQFNEVVHENVKKSSELEILNLSSLKHREEIKELQVEHDKLTIALETSQEELKELKAHKQSLEGFKFTLVRENEEKMNSITKYIEDIENLTTSNSELILQDSLSKKKISTLLQGLQSLKDSVLQLKDENKCLQSQIIQNGIELIGTIRNCVSGLEKVISGLEKGKSDKAEREILVSDNTETLDKDTQCDEVRSTDLLLRELEESKHLVECLKSRIYEFENATKTSVEQQDNEDSELPITPNKTAVCSGCASLQDQLATLKFNLDSLKDSFEKLEGERDDAVEERNELRREAKYLKYVLCYREDVQNLQMSKQQSKELEKLGSNLVEAEKKVVDLEEEVGRLQEEKQTLLLSILNLHSGHEVDDVEEESEEEDKQNVASEESESNDENQDERNISEDSRNTDSISRREQLKFRFQLSLSESDYSFSSEQRTEGEEENESEIEDNANTSQTWMRMKKIKAENQQLKSSLSEATEEKEELLLSLDKLCEEFDALKENYDKLEEEQAAWSKKAKQDKKSFQTRLRSVELDRENLRDSLRQIQDEKLALLKCLEMRNSEPMSPLSPLPQPVLDKIIAQAQSFTQEENKSNEPTSNEEDSEASSSSDAEEEQKSSLLQTSRENLSRLVGQFDVTPSSAKDSDLTSLVASIENDLGKLKERLNRRDGNSPGNMQDDAGNDMESRPRKPPPGERILKRQASTVKSNLDRVCREKQHLQDEVESLRRYLLRRRDSAMEIRKKRSHGSLTRAAAEVENHLEGIKTLQALLGKSDEQLRQSNEIISRLEALNDETEEKLRDSELLQEDLHRAVEIAHNFAMEEQQKANQLTLQNEELLITVEMLKHGDTSIADKKEKIKNSNDKNAEKGKAIPELKGADGLSRSVSDDDGLYADDESTFTTEGESDFVSSRHSSVASESDFVRSPIPNEDDLDILNSNVLPLGGPAKSGGDTETEGTSQHSSTADTSDLTEDEAE